MSLVTLLKFLGILGPFIEPVLLNVENNEIQPELKALIETVKNQELKTFLTGVDAALDALIKSEITKIL